jgi:hypothetical protein
MRLTTAAALLLALAMAGCATTVPDTTGFESTDSVTVPAGFEETWQATKAVLREMELEVYTRDTHGKFVAYSEMRRQLGLLTPKRIKFTIQIEEKGAESSTVSIDTVQQVYGVTLLTYPDWHDREIVDNETALRILEAVRNRLG